MMLPLTAYASAWYCPADTAALSLLTFATWAGEPFSAEAVKLRRLKTLTSVLPMAWPPYFTYRPAERVPPSGARAPRFAATDPGDRGCRFRFAVLWK